MIVDDCFVEFVELECLFCRRIGRGSPRSVARRLVLKNGDCNVIQKNVSKRRCLYLADIFTTMVDIKWRWNILIFVASFIVSWLIFGVLWFLISMTRGDLLPDHLPGLVLWFSLFGSLCLGV